MSIGPPFDNVHQGIAFAFFNGSSCGSNWPTMTPTRQTSGLSRLDVRAQAGQVQAVIGRLARTEAAWIKLAYGSPEEMQQAAADVCEHVIGRLPSGEYPRRMIADLVLWNCGRRKGLSVRDIAANYGWRLSRTYELARKVGQVMLDVGVRAFMTLEDEFGGHGWLKPDLPTAA